jgi:hypothetical protein
MGRSGCERGEPIVWSSPMAINLPTGGCKFTAVCRGVFAHSVMSNPQLRVVAAVRRGGYLSAWKRRQDHRPVGLERPRYENADLDVGSLVPVQHHVLPELIALAGAKLGAGTNELVDLTQQRAPESRELLPCGRLRDDGCRSRQDGREPHRRGRHVRSLSRQARCQSPWPEFGTELRTWLRGAEGVHRAGMCCSFGPKCTSRCR